MTLRYTPDPAKVREVLKRQPFRMRRKLKRRAKQEVWILEKDTFTLLCMDVKQTIQVTVPYDAIKGCNERKDTGELKFWTRNSGIPAYDWYPDRVFDLLMSRVFHANRERGNGYDLPNT